MPRFTPAPSPKCPRCGDSIFATELKIGPNGTPYHARCLTCTLCNKRLDSTLLLEHEGQPYCKHCHAKLLGTGANGFTRAVPLQPRSPEAAGVRVGAFASPHSPTASSPAGLVGSSAIAASRAISASPSAHRSTSPVSSVASSSRAGGTAVHSRSSSPQRPGTTTSVFAHVQRAPASAGSVDLTSAQNVYRTAVPSVSGEYDLEFGPAPTSPPRAPVQSMDDLVNQLNEVKIRPRGHVSVAIPLTERREDSSLSPADEADEAESISSIDAASTVGTVGMPGLPPPRRLTPSKHGTAGTTYKTAPAYGGGTSGVSRLGLGSSISAAAGGTPLCARCAKP
ncbi:hypothetical protein OC842_007442, partial [Tilletia horrida]